MTPLRCNRRQAQPMSNTANRSLSFVKDGNMIPLVCVLRSLPTLQHTVVSMNKMMPQLPHRQVSFWTRRRWSPPQQPLRLPRQWQQPHPQSTIVRSFTATKLMDPDRCNVNVIYRYARDVSYPDVTAYFLFITK